MIMDSRLEFADAASVAAAAGTANLTNQIDTGSVVRDLGNGEPIYLVVTVDTSIVTGGSAGTIAYQLVSDDTASIATNGTQTVHAVSKSFVTGSTATLAAGTAAGAVAWVIALPQGIAYERYLGVQAVIGTTTTTAGKVNAFLTKDLTGNGIYPDALGANQ